MRNDRWFLAFILVLAFACMCRLIDAKKDYEKKVLTEKTLQTIGNVSDDVISLFK